MSVTHRQGFDFIQLKFQDNRFLTNKEIELMPLRILFK